MNRLSRYAFLIPSLLLLGALIGFYLPWQDHAAAALSANAYDLAEWVGLRPGLREQGVFMLPPLFLRATLGGIAVLAALRAIRMPTRALRIAHFAVAIVLAITLLPPVDFFAGRGTSDVNYLQQLMIAVVTAVFIGVVIFFRNRTQGLLRRSTFEAVIGMVLLLIGIFGLLLSFEELRAIGVEPAFGTGVALFFICMCFYNQLVWLNNRSV
jgi:predicted membrane protein